MENNRVKFWVGDFIDNESTPVETRNGVEVKIVNVIRSTGYVCGNIYILVVIVNFKNGIKMEYI